MFYTKVVRPILFRTDPETIHHRVIKMLGLVSRQKILYGNLRRMCNVDTPALGVRLGRLTLPNPVGLAAGFDKYIQAPLAYPMLGFGWAELGSITFSEQPGNPKPRLWRIPDDKGLIVYYGLANGGAEKTARELEQLSTHPVPFGVSIAPTTGLKLGEMANDYGKSLYRLHRFADYITLNVSCPNVAACDAFSQVSFIKELVKCVMDVVRAEKIEKDIFLKIGPDMEKGDVEDIVGSCIESGITGIIATNLVKKREHIAAQSPTRMLNHPGGISGKLVADKSNAVIRQIFHLAQRRLKIIGVGGIFTAEDAYAKIKCGADAVQLVTGFIYGGPLVVRDINRGLVKLLQRDGYKNIAEAVGSEV